MYLIPRLVQASAPVQMLIQELERTLAKGGYRYQPADKVRSRLAAKHNLNMLHEKLRQTRESQFKAYRGALSDPRVLKMWGRLDHGISETQKMVVLEDAILLSLGRELRGNDRGIETSLKESSPKERSPQNLKHGTKDLPTVEAQNSTHSFPFPKLAEEDAEDGVSHGNLAANVKSASKFCYRWPRKDSHEPTKTSGQPNETGTMSVKSSLPPTGTMLDLPRQRFPASQSGRRRIFCHIPISQPPSSGFMLIMSDGKLLELETITLARAATVVGWIKITDDLESVDQESVDQESVDQESVDQESVDQESLDQESVDQESVDQESVDQVTQPEPKIPVPAYGRAKRRASNGALLRFSGKVKPLSKNGAHFRTHVARNSVPKSWQTRSR